MLLYSIIKMKIALAQLNYHIGNFNANLQKMKTHVHLAKDQNADIIVFSELAVCGYPPRDFLEFPDFIKKCQSVVKTLTKLSADIAIIVGAPSINPVAEGKDLYNSAYFLYNAEVKHIAHKALLPTYDIFDEYRYFEPCTDFNIIEFKGERIALTVCEDIWNIGNENPLYQICPMDELIKQQPTLSINISASPFNYSHAEERIRICKENVKRYNIPMFYCNQVGAHTEVIFDGGSLVLDKTGHVFDELPHFKEAFAIYDTTILQANNKHRNNERPKDKTQLIYNAIVLGIRDYFGKLGFKKAILGLSGGIDSAITLALAVAALGKNNVRSVLMPSEFSSEHSVEDSVALCHNLGSPYELIGIKQAYDSFLNLLHPQFAGLGFDVTEENIQARIRGLILMALSNKFGAIVLNTSNKSEAAVGYGTLYGDMCGGLSVLGDVYKMEVYELAHYINREEEIIPKHIIVKPPSAELRPNQKDSDSLPDYSILDEVLYQYIEKRQGPKALIKMGFDEALVKRILRLVNINEYKRYQTAPMLRVSSKAFGVGRRMPIVAKYLS